MAAWLVARKDQILCFSRQPICRHTNTLAKEDTYKERTMEHEVTLSEMLDARERRAFKQYTLLKKYNKTLLCFTMNIAGPIKNSPLIRRGFELGKQFLEEKLALSDIKPLYCEESSEVTGNEAYYIFAENPLTIKKITSDIEDASKLGRLFDMDILDADRKKIDRTELGLPVRLCLICGKPAKDCARSRTHSVSELQSKTSQILTDIIDETDQKTVAKFACRALLYEVCTTPKPGLVDRRNNGSHKDMDIFTFLDSTCALAPYFEQCTKIGRQTSTLPAKETFHRLREAGKKAEFDMFLATKGVNTHKGAIFSVGIICAALGRLDRSQWKFSNHILKECAAMTQGLIADDFSNLTEETAITVGQKLYLNHKITGIRGQIEAGLPAVQNVGLPVLREGMKRGLSINDAGCATLLALITADTDTNLIARSDIATQQKIVANLKELLEENPYPDRQILEQLDQTFIEKNLSPGGSADLLAICYFLYFLESEV